MISALIKSMFLVCTFACAASALAQSVIQRSQSPYVEPSDGRIAVQGQPQAQVASGVSTVGRSQVWEVLLSDGNLYKALSRWALQDGRPVHWEAGKEYPAVYAQYKGSYTQAFEQVMKDTANSSYRLHACEHDNVIRVLHSSQSCRH